MLMRVYKLLYIQQELVLMLDIKTVVNNLLIKQATKILLELLMSFGVFM